MTATLAFRKLAAGRYAVHLDGRDTGLCIDKDTTARRGWGMPQEWDVVIASKWGPGHYDDAGHLFTAKGLDDAKRVLRLMVEHLR
jgi:hypothetical protein